MLLYHKAYYLSPEHDWVILVHGAGGSSSIWFKQIRDFKEQFNLLLIDLRGHGRSRDVFKDYVKTEYSFQEISEDVIRVMDHLKIESAHFVGISLGSIVIRTIGELAPKRLKSMVLGGAVTRLNVRSRILVSLTKVFKKFIPFIWLYQVCAHILMPRDRHKESRNLFIAEAKRLAQQEFLRWFTLTIEVNPLLKYFNEKELSVPTLYIMGEEDYMFLPQVKRLIIKHKNSALRVLHNCGHVVNVEQPELFNRFSIAFMKNPDIEAFVKV